MLFHNDMLIWLERYLCRSDFDYQEKLREVTANTVIMYLHQQIQELEYKEEKLFISAIIVKNTHEFLTNRVFNLIMSPISTF